MILGYLRYQTGCREENETIGAGQHLLASLGVWTPKEVGRRRSGSYDYQVESWPDLLARSSTEKSHPENCLFELNYWKSVHPDSIIFHLKKTCLDNFDHPS